MNWSFFKDVVYINLDSRTDKRIQIEAMLQSAGCYEYARIPGIVSDSPMLGFNQAQINAIEIVKAPALILEDDATLENLWALDEALNELPEDWDIMYLGANVVGTDLCSWPDPEVYSNHLRRVKQAWTTHAIAYSEKGLTFVAENFNPAAGQMYDDWLRCNIENLEAFIVYPMVSDQRPGYSDIWQRDVNYGFFNKWKQ